VRLRRKPWKALVRYLKSSKDAFDFLREKLELIEAMS
jgi:hypothetical protein